MAERIEFSYAELLPAHAATRSTTSAGSGFGRQTTLGPTFDGKNRKQFFQVRPLAGSAFHGVGRPQDNLFKPGPAILTSVFKKGHLVTRRDLEFKTIFYPRDRHAGKRASTPGSKSGDAHGPLKGFFRPHRSLEKGNPTAEGGPLPRRLHSEPHNCWSKRGWQPENLLTLVHFPLTLRPRKAFTRLRRTRGVVHGEDDDQIAGGSTSGR